MRGEESAFKAKGYRVVFIGNGQPHMAQAFAEDFDVTSPLYTDPSLVSYRIAGFKRSRGSIWKMGKNAVRAISAGYMQGLVKGDAVQLGGLLAIDQAGEVRYAYSSDEAGDHPDLKQVLAELPNLSDGA